MKIIEALKSVKNLKRKLSDLHTKINTYSADNDTEDSTYPDQREQVSSWLQACEDTNKEICSLVHRIHKTNVTTPISIEVDTGKIVTKTIDEWLLRLNGLAANDKKTWESLDVRSINTHQPYKLAGSTKEYVVKRRLYFDPKKRDTKIEEYTSELIKIQSKLEIVNAVEDLVD